MDLDRWRSKKKKKVVYGNTDTETDHKISVTTFTGNCMARMKEIHRKTYVCEIE